MELVMANIMFVTGVAGIIFGLHGLCVYLTEIFSEEEQS